jgi:DNA-binding MarR family transcriptional regulator
VRYEDVSRLRKQVKALYRRLQRELPQVEGLPFTAFQMLRVIERAPGRIRPGELAAELEMTNSNVAAALRALEAKGLVVRRQDPTDGRKAFMEMTQLGDKVIAENRDSPSAWFLRSMEQALTEREQRLLLQAGDLMQCLADHHELPAGRARSRRATATAPRQARAAALAR